MTEERMETTTTVDPAGIQGDNDGQARNGGFTGHTHTPETRAKMSESMRKTRQSGGEPPAPADPLEAKAAELVMLAREIAATRARERELLAQFVASKAELDKFLESVPRT